MVDTLASLVQVQTQNQHQQADKQNPKSGQSTKVLVPTALPKPQKLDALPRLHLAELVMPTPEIFKEKLIIGEGTFGKVYKAKIGTQFYALKKIKMDTENPNFSNGFPITSIREIAMLNKLKNHPNIVQLENIVLSQKKSVYLVFEFVPFELQKLIERQDVLFSKMQLKSVLKQMLTGLQYMHKNKIMHRDIKGGNILIDAKGVVKLADFGLARDLVSLPHNQREPSRPVYTAMVVTRWFRAPEIALEDFKNYTEKLDVWSIGCTFAEMIARRTLFPSVSNLDHFPTIIRQLCESDNYQPTEEEWPGYEKAFKRIYPDGLPAEKVSQKFGAGKRGLSKFFESLTPTDQNALMDDETMEIIQKMLCISPVKRPSCTELLNDPYFNDLPEDFTLDIQGITGEKIEKNNGQVVDLDNNNEMALGMGLGKRANLPIDVVDLDGNANGNNKRQKLIQE